MFSHIILLLSAAISDLRRNITGLQPLGNKHLGDIVNIRSNCLTMNLKIAIHCVRV